MNPDLDTMRSDMTEFLIGWGESLSYSSPSYTYDDAGVATTTWSDYAGFVGDFQPLTGEDITNEAGREQKSEAKVECAYDVAVLEGYRILRDGIVWRVNYVQFHEEHAVAFIYREVQQ